MPTYKGGDVDKITRYKKQAQAMVQDRQQGFDSHWRELGDFFMPRRTRFWAGDRNRGDKRNQNIIDSTARFAARTLASGLHAGLTSPARPWMKLTTHNPDLAEQPNVKAWLHEVSKRMMTLFATSNLYNTLPIVYGDLGIFGTGAMAIVDDSRDLYRCYAYPIGTYALGLDARNLATSFVRDYEMTVLQVVEEFGVQPDGRTIKWDGISDGVKASWDRGDYQFAVPVTWVVVPNVDYDPRKPFAKYRKWSSCHYETEAPGRAKFLRDSGYRNFPIMVPRWDITGEDTYGTDCPGMTALGDNKQLQIMQRRKGQLLQKAVDPPLKGPSSLRTQKTSLLSGDITYVDTREGMQGLAPIHEVRLEGFQHLTADVQDVRYLIQRAFYEDLFLMLSRSDDGAGVQPITAREVDERHEEKLLALGPVLERTNDELLDPIVDRVYAMMDEAGLIQEPPDELQGVELRVEYISILSQAQKLVGVNAQERFVAGAMNMQASFPEVRHKLNIFQIINNQGDMLGVDPNIIVPDDQAMAAQQAEAQQAQQMQEAEKAKLMAGAVKDASQAPVDSTGDTALARIVQNAGGAPALAGATA